MSFIHLPNPRLNYHSPPHIAAATTFGLLLAPLLSRHRHYLRPLYGSHEFHMFHVRSTCNLTILNAYNHLQNHCVHTYKSVTSCVNDPLPFGGYLNFSHVIVVIANSLPSLPNLFGLYSLKFEFFSHTHIWKSAFEQYCGVYAIRLCCGVLFVSGGCASKLLTMVEEWESRERTFLSQGENFSCFWYIFQSSHLIWEYET